jgi:hypothetical protein
VQEYAYIQFSADFENVKYGTPEEIARQRQQLADSDVYQQTEEEKAADEERARKKAEKNKRQREKRKEKAKLEKEENQKV